MRCLAVTSLKDTGVLQEIAFDKLEGSVEPIFLAFTALPGEKQAQIEAECQDIDAMACRAVLRL